MEGRHSSPKHTAASAGRTVRRPAGEQPRQPSGRTSVRDTSAVADQPRRREPETIRRAEYTEQSPAEKTRVPGKRKQSSAAGMILRDILLVGIILVVFAFFHHVLPRITARNTVITPKTTASIKTPSSPAVVETPAITAAIPEETDNPVTEPVNPEPIPEEPDGRTDWQRKFADHFTDEVVKTGNSYSSPNISITIDTFSGDYNGYYQTYYVADIYVGSIENFRTYFANGQFVFYGAQDANAMARASGAILSMNGDYGNNQRSGFLVRNGDVYYDDPVTFDICVLFYDGTMETYSPSEYDPVALLDEGVYQSWKFGPKLLDENGKAMTTFNTTYEIEREEAPRSGFGYYEPGHYCFVVVDGRQNHSRGMVLSEFALLFEQLGCTRAYNMDGGASSVLTFDGSTYNKPSGYRELGEILLIAEIPDDQA